MATIPLNETKLHIETTLASVGYAECMIRLADQFRREGNHAAANGALMMAWDIRENTKDAMPILPNLTPEHAALLGQPERQRLSTELNSSYENLNQLGRQHGSTEGQWDKCYEQHAEWYEFCFGVSLAAHLAEAIIARAESLQQSEDNIEMVADAVGKCHQGAKESLEHARKIEPPADAPFPQTRQQSMERALDDCVKLELLDRQLQEKLKGVEREADNSVGRCHLCGNDVKAEDAKAHSLSCVTTAAPTLVSNNLHSKNAGNGTILVWVRADEVRQWMMLAVRPTTSLLQLDQFLRNLWLECCSHMSRFEIGATRYSAHVSDPGDARLGATYLAEPNERSLMYTVEETIRPGELSRHEYDYDYTTCLDLECVAVLPEPYDWLPGVDWPARASDGPRGRLHHHRGAQPTAGAVLHLRGTRTLVLLREPLRAGTARTRRCLRTPAILLRRLCAPGRDAGPTPELATRWRRLLR